MNRKSRWALVPVVLWGVLAVAGWVLPAKEISASERRPLAQMPKLTGETVMNGRFMADFEKRRNSK